MQIVCVFAHFSYKDDQFCDVVYFREDFGFFVGLVVGAFLALVAMLLHAAVYVRTTGSSGVWSLLLFATAPNGEGDRASKKGLLMLLQLAQVGSMQKCEPYQRTA